jgi:hypothetical protein
LHDYALCSLFSATPTCILPSRKMWLVDSCFVTSSWCYISGDIALLYSKWHDLFPSLYWCGILPCYFPASKMNKRVTSHQIAGLNKCENY